MTTRHTQTVDLIGIGFGPSNLALAIALDEIVLPERPGFSCLFLERQPQFAWHGGMLLPDTDMQIAFVKDLVSLRNPTSPYTFINYLRQCNRLEDFVNRKSFFPSRIEFNDYLGWVARRFDGWCNYGADVIAIEPEIHRDTVTALQVRARNAHGAESVHRARAIVLAPGGNAHIPAQFSACANDARVFHSSRYLDAIRGRRGEAPRAIAVIGGGQSAAEIFLDLHGRFPEARIDLVFRGLALKPADDSPLVNGIFNPDFTDAFFQQPEAARRALLADCRNTNYAVVDADLIEKIHRRLYEQKVAGPQRLRLRASSSIHRACALADGIHLGIQDARGGAAETVRYDCAVLATGYARDGGRDLLRPLQQQLGGFSIGRDYRLRTDAAVLPPIFIQGASEQTHGLADTLLSVLSIRSSEIAQALAAALPGAPPPRQPPAGVMPALARGIQ